MDHMQAAAEAIDRAQAEMLYLRTLLAWHHDDLPTEAELIAKLDVYAEFGR